MCVYVCTYICMYMGIWVYMYVYMYVYMFVYMNLCVYVYLCMCLVYVSTYVFIYTSYIHMNPPPILTAAVALSEEAMVHHPSHSVFHATHTMLCVCPFCALLRAPLCAPCVPLVHASPLRVPCASLHTHKHMGQ